MKNEKNRAYDDAYDDAYDSLVYFISRRAIPSDEEIRLRKIIDIIKEAVRQDEREKMAGEAVEFMEWAAGAGWQPYDGPDRWICPQENRVVVTTAGLYKLFKTTRI